MSKALKDIEAERTRQINQEGWSHEHDDQYQFNELAIAGGLYALNAHDLSPAHFRSPPSNWPWSPEWWKPKSAREDLVRAVALLVAEIERIDRKEINLKMIGQIRIIDSNGGYMANGDIFPCYVNEFGQTYITESYDGFDPCEHMISDLITDGIKYEFILGD